VAAPPSPPLEPLGRRRRFASIESAAIAGIICAVGWSLSMRGLTSAPGIAAPADEIRDFYADPGHSTQALVWLQVLVFSTIAFLWFVGVVRGRLGDQEPKLFGTVFFGASILLAGLLFLGGALLAAPAVLVSVGDKAPDPDTVSLTRAAAAAVLSVFAPRIAMLVMLSTASLGRATGALPRWLIWLTYALGVIELVNVTIATPTIYLLPAWVGLVSVVLLVRHPSLALDTEAQTDEG
jgi:uncharacterized membrane protein